MNGSHGDVELGSECADGDTGKFLVDMNRYHDDAEVGGECGVGYEEMKTCRICMCGDEEEELYYPCACQGTIMYVHETCLMEWLQVKKNGKGYKCEICQHTYSFSISVSEDLPPYRRWLSTVTYMAMYIFWMCLSFLLNFIAGVTFVCGAALVCAMFYEWALTLGNVSPADFWYNRDLFLCFGAISFLALCLYCALFVSVMRDYQIGFRQKPLVILHGLRFSSLLGFACASFVVLVQLGTRVLQIMQNTFAVEVLHDVDLPFGMWVVESRSRASFFESRVPPWFPRCFPGNAPLDASTIWTVPGEAMFGLLTGLCVVNYLFTSVTTLFGYFPGEQLVLSLLSRHIFVFTYPACWFLIYMCINGDEMYVVSMWGWLLLLGFVWLKLVSSVDQTLELGLNIDYYAFAMGWLFSGSEPRSLKELDRLCSYTHSLTYLTRHCVITLAISLVFFRLPLYFIPYMINNPSAALQCFTWLHVEICCMFLREHLPKVNTLQFRIGKYLTLNSVALVSFIYTGIFIQSNPMLKEFIQTVSKYWMDYFTAYKFASESESDLNIVIVNGASVVIWGVFVLSKAFGKGNPDDGNIFFRELVQGIMSYTKEQGSLFCNIVCFAYMTNLVVAPVKTERLPNYTWQAPIDLVDSLKKDTILLVLCVPLSLLGLAFRDCTERCIRWIRIRTRVGVKTQALLERVLNELLPEGSIFLVVSRWNIYMSICLLEVGLVAFIVDGLTYLVLGYSYSTYFSFVSLFRLLLGAKIIPEVHQNAGKDLRALFEHFQLLRAKRMGHMKLQNKKPIPFAFKPVAETRSMV